MLKRNKSNTEDILFDNSKPSFALVILNMRYNKRGVAEKQKTATICCGFVKWRIPESNRLPLACQASALAK